MSAPIGAAVQATVASGAAGTATTTVPVATTEGVVLFVRSYMGSSGAAGTPATPAGFTYLGGVENSNSTFRVREDIYYQRGAGSTISANVAATTSVSRNLSLQRFDGIDRNDFVTAAAFTPFTSNRTDASINVPASTYPNAVAVAALAVGGTFGGTGAAWDVGSSITAGASTGSHSVQYVLKPTAGVQTLAATWTTANIAAIAGAIVGGDSATPLATPTVTLTSTTDPTTVGGADGKAVVAWNNVTNAVSYRVEVASGANATTGFSVKSESATSPYTVTGLSDGVYTIAVTAKP